MNLLTPVIEEKVHSGIIDRVGREEYHQASRQISEILVELHASIPDKKRVSYGIVYTIKVLGEYLYTIPSRFLRKLYQEPSPYARTSVGNNLSDLARGIPDAVYDLVGELVDSGDENSYWIAYRACRNLVKADPVKVLDLLRVGNCSRGLRPMKRDSGCTSDRMIHAVITIAELSE